MKYIVFSALFIAILSCGNPETQTISTPGPDPSEPTTETASSSPNLSTMMPAIGVTNPDGSVVKSRSAMNVSLGGILRSSTKFTTSGQIPVSITNEASTITEFDTSQVVMPTITNSVLNLGSISLNQFSDNNLQVCGNAGTTQCSNAIIRIYTTGTEGPGFYNTTGGYGAPITAGQSTMTTVGLGNTAAATLQTINISNTTHVLSLSSFNSPKYNLKADFTNAGAGTYTATLVIEYVLMP